ncbi:A-kinase anchor protein 13 [Latimeria chalumnae]|uniref:A-kinase anchor protein 13 n=1 Tax=Latimeria chalumnae TaxID=7897 RepID=UPI00313CF427
MDALNLETKGVYLQGDCVLSVLLTDEELADDDVTFYLAFAGSCRRHLTTTKRISPGTLQSIAPAHDCCETVKVSLCVSRVGFPVTVAAEQSFQFIPDLAYDVAQFLAVSVGNLEALEGTKVLDQFRVSSGDVQLPDEKVTLAFRHLALPAGWNVLGTEDAASGKNQ